MPSSSLLNKASFAKISSSFMPMLPDPIEMRELRWIAMAGECYDFRPGWQEISLRPSTLSERPDAGRRTDAPGRRIRHLGPEPSLVIRELVERYLLHDLQREVGPQLVVRAELEHEDRVVERTRIARVRPFKHNQRFMPVEEVIQRAGDHQIEIETDDRAGNIAILLPSEIEHPQAREAT